MTNPYRTLTLLAAYCAWDKVSCVSVGIELNVNHFQLNMHFCWKTVIIVNVFAEH